jgi:hypothetical protein
MTEKKTPPPRPQQPVQKGGRIHGAHDHAIKEEHVRNDSQVTNRVPDEKTPPKK